jgi:L-fuculose-phosphate aldolase
MADVREEIVLACRGLATHGCGSGIGGHVSVRNPNGETYFINAFDRTFAEMTPGDILEVDRDGKVLSGGRQPSLGVDFHSGIYGLRPDVNAIVHTHGAWITAMTAFQRPPRMWHNLCTFFYEDCVMSPDDSFEAIAPALGDKSTVLIPWHGAITVGSSLGRAAALHDTLEYASRLEVTLTPTGASPLPDEVVPGIRALVERATYLDETWQLLRREGARSLATDGLVLAGART